MLSLSVIILTYNEESNLPDCMASLDGLNAGIFVVDSGSTDRTREIAGERKALVVEHPFDNYAAQRNWALQNLPMRTEWILNLDADERLTPALVSEINETLGGTSPDVDGFLLRKRTTFMGRWINTRGKYHKIIVN